MKDIQSLRSEEDIRGKIVLPWLIERGFSLNDISLEFSFRIRMGRSTFVVKEGKITKNNLSNKKFMVDEKYFLPRADALVRSTTGKNLLIVEVKAHDEPLDDTIRDQGISYARLLDGNIAPLVVLTNGRDVKIFDSFTKQQINDYKISVEHDSLRESFSVNADDLLLRSEALQSLISLSPDNLVAFCQGQSEFRMRLLKSDDLYSGKKYIPSLYIERGEAKDKLYELLDNQKRRVVILVGPPQVGKTNFVCHMVEERLANGLPTLFYPAIGVKQSLLSEMAEDFEWIIGESSHSNQIIHQKLRRVLRRSGKGIVVFIDGWDEANIKLARVIDYESERLSCDELQIVISLTHVAASRLLGKYGGNPSFLADAASISSQAAKRIEITSDITGTASNWSLVNIKKYSEEEKEKAYEIYSNTYQVAVPNTHQKVDDPYALGVAMRLFHQSILPDLLDEPDLLEKIINEKSCRAIGLDDYNIHACLSKLAEEIFNNGAPVALETLCSLWNIPVVKKIPEGFYESALLAQVTNEDNFPSVDFYYGKERDYILAYWARNWLQKLKKQNDIADEFSRAADSPPYTFFCSMVTWKFSTGHFYKSF